MADTGRWRRAARLGRRDLRDDVDDELRFHLEMRERELLAAGLPPALARAEAERRFGAVQPIRDACVAIDRRQLRRSTRAEAFTGMLQDLRFALRTLRLSRAFTLVAVLTLALGIGATTAVFSVVDAVLLRPLPWAAPERLVVPRTVPRPGSEERWPISYLDYEAWREQGVFEHVALYAVLQRDLTGEGEPVRVTAARVTEDFFATLGVRPLLGRLPGPGELDGDGANPLVISHGLWQRHFGGAPDVVGRTLRVRGEAGTVVAVLPPHQGWPQGVELWHGGPPPPEPARAPDNFAFDAIGRLAPGVAPAQARARLATIAAALAAAHPAKRAGVSVTAVSLRDAMVGATLARALWVLLGAVGLVLLIACVNVANLMLARAAARGRELALRGALGASRVRLVRQLLVESLLLAAAGGALGLLLSLALVRGLVALAPDTLPRLDEVGLDGPVVLVAAGVTTLCALLFGLVPALQASGTRPAQALVEGGARATGGVRGQRTAGLLVVGEVALALTLLTGAGLLTRSLLRLRDVDAGVERRGALTFQLSLPPSRYPDTASRLAFYDELRARLAALPGVEAAGLSSTLPLGGGGMYLGRAVIETGAPEPPAGREVLVMWSVVSPGFFRAAGQRLVAGRDFEAGDDSAATPVVVVNQRFVEAMYPDGDALGRRVFSWRDERLSREIVGVVNDVRYFGASDSTRPIVYVPLAQDPYGSATVVVRAAGDAAALGPAVRRTLAALDPEIAMARARTMDEVLDESIAPQRFNALLLGTFAGLAALLAAIGLYGLLAYGVTQRTRELGVRMALGATGGEVVRLVLGRSLRLVAVGAVLGLGGALALTRVLQSLLFEVEPTDPLTLASVTALLVAVALLASWLPARRAARVDPATSLRA